MLQNVCEATENGATYCLPIRSVKTHEFAVWHQGSATRYPRTGPSGLASLRLFSTRISQIEARFSPRFSRFCYI